MCGIAVILPGGAVDVPPFAVDRMAAALRHRGPDEQASLRLPGCHLGHTRLSVIDPESGQQPMADPSGRYTVVFNGEIYNHRDLRRQLEREERAVFHTRCDTEVLLHGYAAWGRGVLSRLNGQFAFAIWDSLDRELFVARDRFGEKPLYWARTAAGDVLVASEIKAILASGLVKPRLDLVSVDAYLGLYYVPPDRSIYENVHPVRPGTAAMFRGGDDGVETWRYWSPQPSVHDVDEAEAAAHVRLLLEKAVERQTVADVPVGAFLSGGLDSSTIVALMARQAGARRVSTFSVGFGDLIDELPFARDVAAAYGTDHHEMQMDIDVAEMLERMTHVYDEPFGDSSNIPTYLVSEYARRGVKVVLSGDGGDEIFGGYDWYRGLLASAPGASASAIWEQHVAGATGMTAGRSGLWSPRPAPPSLRALRETYSMPHAGMDVAAAFDAACYLPGDILAKVDRAAMAHGLETRSPFLDVELTEFVLGLPWQMRFASDSSADARGTGAPPVLKHLLRVACEDLWPPSVRTRGKQGFGAPVRHWLTLPSVAAMWGRVTKDHSPLLSLLPGLRAAEQREQLRPQRKWSLLCLGHWLESQGAAHA